jgi:hypothetical protein
MLNGPTASRSRWWTLGRRIRRPSAFFRLHRQSGAPAAAAPPSLALRLAPIWHCEVRGCGGPDGSRPLLTNAQYAEMRRKRADLDAKLKQMTAVERTGAANCPRQWRAARRRS